MKNWSALRKLIWLYAAILNGGGSPSAYAVVGTAKVGTDKAG